MAFIDHMLDCDEHSLMNKYFANHAKRHSISQGHSINDLHINNRKQYNDHDFEKRLSQILETTYFA
ncbi:hypothetical protein H8356DRAFT_1710667 [Neocallimastix lanati (nom. inval.)]|uniref:Uncharacterized protein n=1 Tax=Neocallimastix californiae TaxID=1754190 RepID=A0A1Y2APA4_9FUNG|nr:hypothetical protein H8356DRAFT_1710667 [Neocallimastix sp. JGI-2020a]ORY24326.1 hypothetical protein LY90DRAFT_706590 [Neocallimastix californiae]|eukprot:ORY24326.1 hypothetical protein LY90DRAFT_706590 [Neocallimastix californiae]